jgi:putative hydrolase of HD superfamily
MIELTPQASENQTNSKTFNDIISDLIIPYGLKEVYRAAKIGERQESVSEHVGSMLALARWFIRTYNLELDMLRVVDLICDHDLPELICGDTPIIPGVDSRKHKELKEAEATRTIAKNISSPTDKENFLRIIAEYKAGETPEAKFVRAIDKLDADLQFLNDKEAFRKWGEEYYRTTRERFYKEVPAIWDFYQHFLNYLRINNYFYL